MERENSNLEQVKDQEGRVMRHLRKAANGRRKAAWHNDQELRDMVSRAWSSLALRDQVAVLLQRLAH